MEGKKVTEREVQEGIEIILSDKRSYATSLNYAVNYAKMAQGMSGEELRIQILYLSGNLVGWRHPEAKRIKELFRRFCKESAPGAGEKKKRKMLNTGRWV